MSAPPAAGAPAGGRVAHVLWRLGERSETFLADALAALDAAGWETWAVPYGVTNRDEFPFPPDARIVPPCRPPGPAGVWPLALPGHRRRGAAIAEAVRRVAPVLVHAHYGTIGIDALPAARRLSLPLVVTFHGFDLTRLPDSRRMRARYRELLVGAGAVIVVSRFLAARAEALVPGLEPAVIPAGVHVAAFPWRAPRAGGQAARLLFVGRQVEMKGLDVLLRAMPAILAGHPRARLDVLGEGPRRAAAERLAGSIGVADRVSFHGAVPRREVAAAMHAADILVVPSLTAATGHAEGHPTVVKEALATGTMVVATRSGGLPETLPPELRDELVPEGDPRALAERVLALLENPGSWRARSQAGREFVTRNFDWSVITPRLVAVYRETVARAAATRGR